MKDRRRSQRIEIESDEVVRLELRRKVRLRDISHSGALMSCEPGLLPGAHGHLRTGLGTQPFKAEVAVRRHDGDGVPRGEVGLAAEFINMDEQSRRHLLEFLRRTAE